MAKKLAKVSLDIDFYGFLVGAIRGKMKLFLYVIKHFHVFRKQFSIMLAFLDYVKDNLEIPQ